MKNNTFSKKFWIYSILYVFACVAICFVPALLTNGSVIDFTETGQIGDTIGGIVGPIIAMIAAYLTFIAFWIQKQANELQRRDIKVERFNSNFYNLLNVHEQITSSLEFNTYIGLNGKKEPITYHGRELFYYAFELNAEYDNENNVIGEGMRGRMLIEGQLAYMDSLTPTYFDHYFRNMYRIVKYIDEINVFDDLPQNEADNKKHEYVAILRSTLSRYELVWLFYNALSEYGRDKFKPLIEKYALLSNIRVELLVNMNDVKQFDVGAFGGTYPQM